MQNALQKPDNAGAGSYDYMHLFGLVALGYMWAQMAKAALAGKGKGNGASAAMDAKLTTGRFFMERMLPETGTHLARIQAGAGTVMELPADAFSGLPPGPSVGRYYIKLIEHPATGEGRRPCPTHSSTITSVPLAAAARQMGRCTRSPRWSWRAKASSRSRSATNSIRFSSKT